MSIIVENLSFTYGKKTPYEKKALNDVSFTINDGEFVGIVGATGSGKSTLIQHLNGLIKLKEGRIVVDETDLSAKKPQLQTLRKKIGMLFQYPEYQLFADTVLADVTFGPRNFGYSKEDAVASAKEALTLVGLDYEEIKDRSPIEISGGQKRRVAMAGVLAYNPTFLVLDEPTAGLDPIGKREMLDMITSLRNSGKVKTVIMVSHNMDEIAEYTDRILVLKDGSLAYDTTPNEFFYGTEVETVGLSYPHVVKIVRELSLRGINLPNVLNKKDLTKELVKFLSGDKNE